MDQGDVMDRRKLRRLLASSSFAAILIAAGTARGGLVGVGVVAEISAQFEAVVDYGGQFSGSGNSHTGSLGLRFKL
jgi:hypothetical protein